MSQETNENIRIAPIQSLEEDVLGRASKARDLVQELTVLNKNKWEHYKEYAVSEASTSMALVGSWGSGKSSFMNLMKLVVREQNAGDYFVFNPWLLKNKDEEIAPLFIKELGIFLGQESFLNKLKNGTKELFKQASKELLSMSDEMTKMPVSKLTEAFANGFTGEKKTAFVEKYESVFRILAKQRFPETIFIFVDDLERCFPEEIKDFLKLIRGVGGLPGLIYVTAFDKEILANQLATNPDDGYRFINKFFDTEYTLTNSLSFLTKQIMESNDLFIKDEGGKLLNFINSQPDLLIGIKYLQLNLRDVHALLRHIKKTRGYIPVDAFILRALELSKPSLWNEIKTNFWTLKENISEEEKKLYWPVFSKAHPLVKRLVSFVFPQLNDSDGTLQGNLHLQENEWKQSAPLRYPNVLNQYYMDSDFEPNVINVVGRMQGVLSLDFASYIKNDRNMLDQLTDSAILRQIKDKEKEQYVKIMPYLYFDGIEDFLELYYVPLMKIVSETYAVELENPFLVGKMFKKIQSFTDFLWNYIKFNDNDSSADTNKLEAGLLYNNFIDQVSPMTSFVIQESLDTPHHRELTASLVEMDFDKAFDLTGKRDSARFIINKYYLGVELHKDDVGVVDVAESWLDYLTYNSYYSLLVANKTLTCNIVYFDGVEKEFTIKNSDFCSLFTSLVKVIKLLMEQKDIVGFNFSIRTDPSSKLVVNSDRFDWDSRKLSHSGALPLEFEPIEQEIWGCFLLAYNSGAVLWNKPFLLTPYDSINNVEIGWEEHNELMAKAFNQSITRNKNCSILPVATTYDLPYNEVIRMFGVSLKSLWLDRSSLFIYAEIDESNLSDILHVLYELGDLISLYSKSTSNDSASKFSLDKMLRRYKKALVEPNSENSNNRVMFETTFVEEVFMKCGLEDFINNPYY